MEGFKSEFKLKNFGLKHDIPDEFSSMRFCGLPPVCIWCWRVLITVYSLGTLLFSIIYYNNGTWLTFLTNWSLVLMAIYFVSITAISGLFGLDYVAVINEDVEMTMTIETEEAESSVVNMAWYLKFFWAWFSIAYVITAVTDVMYWGFVYQDHHYNTVSSSFLYINDHAVLFILLLIDLLFHQIPVRIYHFIYPLIVALLYLVMSISYSFASGKYVYKVLDWEGEPGTAVGYFCIALIMAFIMQMIMYGIYRLKLKYK